MRDAGEPSRNWRRPSISVSAAAISAARACAGVASPPPAVTRDRERARQHEDLVLVVAAHDLLGEPERVAQHERGRREPAAAAAAEADLDAHARGAPAGL